MVAKPQTQTESGLVKLAIEEAEKETPAIEDVISEYVAWDLHASDEQAERTAERTLIELARRGKIHLRGGRVVLHSREVNRILDVAEAGDEVLFNGERLKIGQTDTYKAGVPEYERRYVILSGTGRWVLIDEDRHDNFLAYVYVGSSRSAPNPTDDNWVLLSMDELRLIE